MSETTEFMFRDQEIRRIQAALQNKVSILLVGIRRTGKTMLIKEIIRRHTDSGKAVYLEVSNFTSLYSFYDELMAHIPKPLLRRMVDLLQAAKTIPSSAMNWLRSHIDSVDLEISSNGTQGKTKIALRDPADEAAITRYWEPIAKAMMESLKDVSGEIAFFAIDEFPFMLENLLNRQVPTEEITVALATLRKLRNGGIPMLLSGSISLDNLLTLHNIPGAVLGDLQRDNLPPFSREEARSYLETHLANHPTAAKIEDVLDCLPDFIPVFLNQSIHFLRGLPNANDVDVTMDNLVLPAIRRSFNTQFQERLNKNYPDDELSCAEQLLDQLADAPKTGAFISIRNLSPAQRRALTKLEYDMFVEEAPDHSYRFTLNALRLWWRNQRGMKG
ncbi:MAG: ATP-binding protein [Betaproteobacteria bacterium]|nr:ATP-binding protein [Betaproteobacteria bacterium]